MVFCFLQHGLDLQHLEISMNWDNYFKDIAETVKLKSKDESTKIGAVIVGDDNEIISTGYNSFPRGLNDDLPERQERPEKYNWFEHAERNAIYNAARIGVSVKGARMYLTCGVPCIDCARGIINSGIKKIYCVKGESITHGLSGKHWEENITKAETMLVECGIEICYYS